MRDWPSSEALLDLPDLLELRARTCPDATAVTFLDRAGEHHLTWSWLHRRGQSIAAWLQENRIDGPVLLAQPAGQEFLSGLLGCMMARLPAIPAPAPAMPRHTRRLEALARVAAPQVVFVDQAVAAQAQSDSSPALWRPAGTIPDAESHHAMPVDGTTPTLIQFTSGSTRHPRGVVVTASNLSHQQRWIYEAFAHDPQTVVVTWLPPFHDMGLVGGLLHPLYAGLRCVWMSPRTMLRDPVVWLDAISRYRGTTSGAPNFAYDLCTRRVPDDALARMDLSSWRIAFSGAEPVRADTLERFQARFSEAGFRSEAFFPCYGLAEATLMVSGGPAGETRVLDLVQADLEGGKVCRAGPGGGREGRVFRAVSCGRVDPAIDLALVAPGTSRRIETDDRVGEIWLRGPSIAAGYHGAPTETESVFRATLDGKNYLRTGDLGFLVDGRLFVLGRGVDLVVVRGRNHVPDDLERTAQASHRALRPGAGAVFRHDAPGEPEVVLVQEADLGEDDPADVIAAVRESVAMEHGVELTHVALVAPRSLPRTTSGKIRRKATKALYAAGDVRAAEVQWAPPAPELPASPLEADLCRAFSHVLKADVRATDSFLLRGGDSLAAVTLAGVIERWTRLPTELVDVLEAPTPRRLAHRLEVRRRTRAPRSEPAAVDAPLTPSQQRIWFFEQLRRGQNAFYHVGLVLTRPEGLDRQAARTALEQLVARHEAMRAVFHNVEGQPVQRFVEPYSPTVAELAGSEGDNQAILDFVRRPFELDRGPLLRSATAHGPEGDRWVVAIHHIVCDGWAATTVQEELTELYEAAVAGRPPNLSPAASYRDACAAHHRRVRDRAASDRRFWSDALSNAPTPVGPETSGWVSAGVRERETLAPETARALRSLAHEWEATPFMLLLGLLYAQAARWTGELDLVIGTADANRADGLDAPGCFVNYLPLRVDLTGDPDLREVVRRARRTCLAAAPHRFHPFDELVRSVESQRTTTGNPLYRIGLWHHGYAAHVRPGVSVVDTGTAEISLRLIATDRLDGGIDLDWEYATDAFDAHQVQTLADGYLELVHHILKDASRRLSELEVDPRLSVVVTSNLTAELVREPLEFLLDLVGMPSDVQMAPFDQVVQQLLDPTSSTRRSDVGIVLVDLDAWWTDGSGPARVSALCKALTASPADGLIVAVCPPASDQPEESAIREAAALVLATAEEAGAGKLDLTPAGQQYAVARWRDPFLDELGQLGFTEEWFAAAAALIARSVRLASSPRAHKVLVLDCDGTLWDGICANDGWAGLKLPDHKLALQRAALGLKERGVLLCLLSNNIPEDVRAVFEERHDMPLGWDDIAAHVIDWNPKSTGLRQLADRLDLDIASFVFVDDDGAQCAEVRHNCPEVAVLHLPEDARAQATVLDRLWLFDRASVTPEDRKRTELYRQDAERREHRAALGDLDAFIEGLEITVELAPLSAETLPRAQQLITRSTQFNAAGRHPSEERLRRQVDSEDVLTVRVRDRFGDYGVSGVVALSRMPSAVRIDNIVLSCRVLGRRVEHEVLARIDEQVDPSLGLEVVFAPTRRNAPARRFLEALGADLSTVGDGAAVSLDRSVDPRRAREATAGVSLPKASAGAPQGTPGALAIATSFDRASAVLEATRLRMRPRPVGLEAPVPADGPLEGALLEVFEAVLRIEGLGVQDNFFVVGGHSLLATQVLWRVSERFGIRVDLAEFLAHPTVRGCAELVALELVRMVGDANLADILDGEAQERGPDGV